MSVSYQSVLWNRQKKIYDWIIFLVVVFYVVIYMGLTSIVNPEATAETSIIRATGSLALVMLHIILVIGPLSRLNKKFLMLLYNRRHLGVSMFLVATVHGVFNILQFHSGGDINPIASVFLSNTHYGSLVRFPFQTLGFFALVILFFMAVSSHDFWLKNLSPRFWKGMHMMVYVAYAAVVMHVMLGVAQSDKSNTLILLVGLGMVMIITLHLIAATKSRKEENSRQQEDGEFFLVGSLEDIKDDRAKVIHAKGESIAVFKYEGKLSAISNVCKHQNGPLGEGKIIDGCITCPWHGYQYLPNNGCSPPPFTEKVSTYSLKIEGKKIWVNATPHPEGTELDPVKYQIENE